MNKTPDISNIIRDLTSLNAYVDNQLKGIEERLGPQAALAAADLLERMTPEGETALAHEEKELSSWLQRNRGYGQTAGRAAVEGMLEAGLLRRAGAGKIRLASNALAEELSHRFLGQRQLQQEMIAYIRDHQQRGELLTKKGLDYVLPHLDKLPLDEEARAFVHRSRRAEERRRHLIWGFVAAVIIALSYMTYVSINKSLEANEAQKAAERNEGLALASADRIAQQRDSITAQRDKLDLLTQELKLARDSALRNAAAAVEQRDLAVISKMEADSLRRQAEGYAANTLSQLDTVEKYQKLAERRALREQEARKLAEYEKERSKNLALVIKARNVALRIPGLSDEDAEKKAVLALQAFQVSTRPEGDSTNPAIFLGLENAYASLRRRDGRTSRDLLQGGGHQENVTSIVEGADGYYF